jgi:peptidoglycan-N-acetylglucosamine deacetylase
MPLRDRLVYAAMLVGLCAAVMSGCAPVSGKAQQTVPPLEAAEDAAGQVSTEPTAGLTREASSAPWPADADELRARWSGIEFRQIATTEKLVALTLDDGPHQGMMIQATDILERAGAKATFFCIGGRVLLNVAETKYAFAHGMEIENHTWSHRELDRSRGQDIAQILGADAIIGEVTGTRPLWVRPKAGGADATGTAAIFQTGHLFAGWSVHGGDTSNWNAKAIEQHVLDRVRPGDVVDLHVTNPRTIEALPGILDGLKARGYRMVTLSELALAAP